MYKSTLILAIAFGSMAFLHSGKSYSINKEENHGNNNLLSFTASDQSGKGNKGGNGNKGGGNHGNQAGPSKHNSQEQHGNGHGNGNGKNKHHTNSHNSKNNQFKEHGNNKSNNLNKGNHSKVKNHKPGKNHFDKGHPNYFYVYDNNHGYISHKNYGQWRSEQARNKHKKYRPVYEYEAIEGFNIIIGRNVFLHTETKYKIDLYRNRLSKKRKAGTITVIEYDNSIRRVAVLEQRRADLQINIKL